MKNRYKIFILLLFFSILNMNISYGFEPNVSAQSAIVIEVETGRMLYQKNIDKQLPMASTTKILTALVAIENGNLDDLIKVTSDTTNIEGSSIYLQGGETLSLRDLLYGLMLCSGNDAACTIAKHIGGSIENFSKMMNQKAAEIGALNSSFVNPHGLTASGHYTTAYDLALISREAMKNEVFKKIVGTKLWIAEREGNRYKYFYNKNKVLSQYNGGTGVKIGYTKNAGRCLVASAKKEGMEVICVVLNDSNWFNNAYSLMNHSFNTFKPVKIIEKNQIFKTVPIKNGTKEDTKIVAKEEVILPLQEHELKNVAVLYSLEDQLIAPFKRKQVIGTAKVYLEKDLLSTVDIITREDVDYENNFLGFIKSMTIDKIQKTIDR